MSSYRCQLKKERLALLFLRYWFNNLVSMKTNKKHRTHQYQLSFYSNIHKNVKTHFKLEYRIHKNTKLYQGLVQDLRVGI